MLSASARQEIPAARAAPDVRGAGFAVVILTAMNLLNYVDRYVPSAVKDLFKADLHLSDKETSLPLTAFVVVYMVASPVFGSFSESVPRKWLISIGVALWSAATAAAAFAVGFWSFLFARAAVGVGEAAYATLTPSILSDFYPAHRRNRILMIFYMAIPLGAAIGYTLGGYLGQHAGWRTAFLACGLPGLLTAGLVLAMREPPRGQFDDPHAHAKKIPWAEALRFFRSRRDYVNAVLGYTAVTCASGALADWLPTFLSRYRGFSIEEAGRITGVTAALGGLIGTFAGGALADWLRRRIRNAYLAVSAWSMAGCTVFAVLSLTLTNHAAIWGAMLCAQILLWCYNSPINTIIVNAVPAELRAQAVAVSIFCIHAFGDASSPTIVGIIDDLTKAPTAAYGNLQLAIGLVPLMMVVGTLVWMYGWRALPELPGEEPA